MIKNNGFKILIFLFFVLFISCEKEKKETTDDIYNTWEVVDFMSIESMLYSKNNNYNPVIEFKNDGSFSLKLDANNCFGSFEITGENNLKIGAAGCTKICCDSDFSNKFVEMLSQVESYSFEDNQLKLNVPE